MTKMRRISRLILELEPLAYLYEKNGTDLFKVCSELVCGEFQFCRIISCEFQVLSYRY